MLKKVIMLAALFSASTSYGANYMLQYKARSGLIHMGSSNMNINKTGDKYYLTMQRDLAIPGMMKEKSTASVEGIIKQDGLYPSKFVQTRQGNELTRTTNITWNEGKANVTLNPPLQTRPETELDMRTTNNSVDPITSIYRLMHALDKGRGCGDSFVSFDGVSTIYTGVDVVAQKRVNTPFYKGPAVGCALSMTGMSGLIMGGNNSDKEAVMKIWFAPFVNNNEYIPVIIETSLGSKRFSLLLEDMHINE